MGLYVQSKVDVPLARYLLDQIVRVATAVVNGENGVSVYL